MSRIDRAATAPRTRITNLDAVRGIAVLGILPMNVVSYALVEPAYFNLDTVGTHTALDWVIGVFGEVFVDQKFMGLFSMLFGAGIVLFADRAAAKGGHPVFLGLWRNLLLLGIGLLHSLLWDGDVLVVYALCAPVLMALRRLAPKVLFVLGFLVFMVSPAANLLAQSGMGGPGDLGGFWTQGDHLSDTVGVVLLVDFFTRALGMMLIGVGLYRIGLLDGTRPRRTYRNLVLWGLGIGLPLSVAGVAWMAVEGWSWEVALVGSIPNSLGTIPMTLAYLGIVTIWNGAGESGSRDRIRAVGRMALTNYLAQTVLGVSVFSFALAAFDATRTTALAFVLCVWGLELWWSQAWLARYLYGPAEWLWRTATYRRGQPLRRSPAG